METEFGRGDSPSGMAAVDVRDRQAGGMGAVARATHKATQAVLERQHPDGYWCGELEGDSLLQSEFVMLQAFLGREHDSDVQAAARQLIRQQAPAGWWSQYPGAGIDISASVKAYFALKLAGYDPDSEPLRRARQQILLAGGADAVNSFTRFYLALLGQIPYQLCPAVPPEAILLPAWSPVNIYRVSAWSRTILVPLSIVWALRPVRHLPASVGVQELLIRPPRQWPRLRSPGAGPPRWFSWETAFHGLDQLLKWCEACRLRPLRRLALRRAQRWIQARQEASDGLGAIFPSILWSAVALRSLHGGRQTAEVESCLQQLQALMLRDTASQSLRLQPCQSPVWDTALMLRVLASAGQGLQQPAVRRAAAWLLTKQTRRPGDWSRSVSAEPGGWYFEHRNEFYPDMDDTVVSVMALREAAAEASAAKTGAAETAAAGGAPAAAGAAAAGAAAAEAAAAGGAPAAAGVGDAGAGSRDAEPAAGDGRAAAAEFRGDAAVQPVGSQHAAAAPGAAPSGGPPLAAMQLEIDRACERAERWVLAMQNRDGGWGAFDRDNDAQFLCHVPFADHNAMIDPSTPDIAARVLECLPHRELPRAVRYLLDSQEHDGSWYGRWGVNYIYGTWQALVGLEAAGLPHSHPAVQRGRQWLIDRQQPHGGWGESPASYEPQGAGGVGPATPSQTAWAVLGLLASGSWRETAVQQGVGFLLDRQRSDGMWDEPQFTGTGFPQVFYLRYHFYPLYYPLHALGRYLAAARSGRRRASAQQSPGS